MSFFQQYCDALSRALAGASTQGGDGVASAEPLAPLLAESQRLKASGATQFFVGNGASSALASHVAADWTKNGGIASLALTDAALLTAAANDLGVEEMFASPLARLGRAGDLLVTISSSGNSPNILRAIAAARAAGMRVVTFSGLRPDNQSRALGDANVYVPARTYGIVESAHQVLLHAWLDAFLGVEEWNRAVEQNMRASAYTP
ncbi:MAG: SIS domain-containing protein [Polyangiales bacterium]